LCDSHVTLSKFQKAALLPSGLGQGFKPGLEGRKSR
jgi:hypothetical protein